MAVSSRRGLCPEDGPELAALLAADTLAGRAFARVLPELRTNAAAIAGAHAPGGQELLRLPAGDDLG